MSTDPDQEFHVAIVGAGIAGLTLALGLLRRGIRTTVYERQKGLREIGAGIGFTPNAERAMLALHPGIHAAFKRVAVQNGKDWFHWRDGEAEDDGDDLIHEMYLGERGFEGCLRADLLEEMAKLIPDGTVQYGKSVLDVVDENDEKQSRCLLKFTDGSTAHADVVVACDGLRSRIRPIVLGDGFAAGYSHKYAFRGLIPMAQAVKVLGQEKAMTRNMYLGPDAHAVMFPVAGGAILNFVAFATDPQDWQDAEKLTAPAAKHEAVKALSRFNETLKGLVELLPEQLDKWAVFDMHDRPASTFIKGRVCLAGDAAHAAAPYHGAGAGFAVEDALVLAELLDVVRSTDGGERQKIELVRAALETYNSIRFERATWLVESGRYVGRMYQWQDETVGRDHGKCAKEIDWRSKNIWNYDVQGMINAARDDFRKKTLEV